MSKIPEFLFAIKDLTERWNAFMDYLGTKNELLPPHFTNEELNEIKKMWKFDSDDQNTAKNKFEFEDVIVDFDNWCLRVWPEQRKVVYRKSFPVWNSTYSKKAVCAVFALLSIFKEWEPQRQQVISIETGIFRWYFRVAFSYVFTGKRKEGTSNELNSGSEIKNVFPIICRMTEKSRYWKFKRKGAAITVEKTV